MCSTVVLYVETTAMYHITATWVTGRREVAHKINDKNGGSRERWLKNSFRKEVGVRVNDLVFWLTLWLNFENWKKIERQVMQLQYYW